MVTLVQTLYKSRDIRNIKTATNALDILTKEKNIKKFQTKFKSITKLINKKSEKQATIKAIKHEKVKDKIKEVEEVVYRPSVKIEHRESEAPFYELKFKRQICDFHEAWNAGVKLLTKVAAKHMETNKKSAKIIVGMELIIIKQRIADDDMMHEWDEVPI